MQSGLLVFTDFVGIVAFALAGILAAENRRVDPVGVFVMAFTTAFGGGLVLGFSSTTGFGDFSFWFSFLP